ncbi:MAG: DUF4386 domain-containing protein [Chloroflexota bacterium]
MSSVNSAARSAGALYIIGTVAGILSLTVTGPVRNTQDYLASVAANETQLVLGALCIITMGLALAMIPVVLFPILRKYNEALALGYVVFRGGLEAVSYLAVATSWLLLIPVRQLYIQAGDLNTAGFQALGTLLLLTHELGSILTIVFCLSALIFYYVLYRTKLVPRWLSGWGLIAIVPYVTATLLAMFGTITTLSTTYVMFQIPLAIQEMALAAWLIVKGFNSSATVLMGSTQREHMIDAIGQSAEGQSYVRS